MLLTILFTVCAIFTYSSSAATGDNLSQQVAQEETARPSVPPLRRFSLGEVLYLRQCADCHGWEGRGDGPLAAILAVKPSDLRKENQLFAQNSDAQLVARMLYGLPLPEMRVKTSLYNEAEVNTLMTFLRRLPTTPWEDIEHGKAVYDSLCAACHGLYGRGDGLGARTFSASLPDLSTPDYQQHIRDDVLIHSITNGKGAMPGAGDILSAHEIRAVVTFLHALSPGYELYSRFCAHCHGVDGIPSVAHPTATTSTTSPTVPVPPRFDEAYFREHKAEQIREGIQHMHRQPRPAMPHLARQLTADEAREIVQYLRTLSSLT